MSINVIKENKLIFRNTIGEVIEILSKFQKLLKIIKELKIWNKLFKLQS